MLFLIKHLDQIARIKQRDVLSIRFAHYKDNDFLCSHYDYEEDVLRKTVIAWLEQHAIPYEMCAEVASENCMIGYLGRLYIDVPMDDSNPQYKLLCDYLEHPDGSMKFETVVFEYLPLETAMKNAHHDEPGFWERWAENF